MCGIFGWDLRKRQEPLRGDQKLALSLSLFMCNDSRGGDSWGVFGPDDGSIVKGLGRGSPAFREAMSHNWVIGHTRKKTTGAISKENQHPFSDGPVVGVHNGMVSSHEEANEMFGRKFEVDSQHLIRHLADDRPLADWRALRGYGTLCWTDERRAGQTMFVRFNSGVLSIIKIKGGGIIWSSDDRHIKLCLKIADLEIDREFKFPETKVHATHPDPGTDDLVVYPGWIRDVGARYASVGAGSYNNGGYYSGRSRSRSSGKVSTTGPKKPTTTTPTSASSAPSASHFASPSERPPQPERQPERKRETEKHPVVRR